MTETLYYTGTATTPGAGSNAAATNLVTRVVPYTGYRAIRVSGTIKVVEAGGSTAQSITINTKIGANTKATTYTTAAAADVNYIPILHEVVSSESATVIVEVATLTGADATTTYSLLETLIEGVN